VGTDVSAAVTLEPWGSGDLPLLERLMGDARMTEHLGGPESPDQLRRRQDRYERPESGMHKIVDAASGAGIGSVGFWTKEWRGEPIYEIGWMVVPEYQGRGVAIAATAQTLELAQRTAEHRFIHAFPNVDNAPSNQICRRLGFESLGPCEFEFPKGHFMTCNDWRLDLGAPGSLRPAQTSSR
jgi:RimJ/RimL family protein N-acetyltransferase